VGNQHYYGGMIVSICQVLYRHHIKLTTYATEFKEMSRHSANAGCNYKYVTHQLKVLSYEWAHSEHILLVGCDIFTKISKNSKDL
jgi:hypothetical protein